MTSAEVPHAGKGPLAWSALIGLAVAVLAPAHAAAEGPFEGEWRASSRRVGIELQSWGDDCPGGIPLRQNEPGGAVHIAQSGDHLTFSGAVRGSTRACWSDQPGLRRSAASYQGGTWRVTCATPPNVAQGESGTYTFRAEGQDRIVFEERTRWDWRLRNSRCTATRRSRQTFTRVVDEDSQPAEAEQEPSDCRPGSPARLIISPRRAELRAGERVCFRTRVTDRAGCPVPGAQVALSLDTAEGRRGRLDGQCFFAGETAADAEGTFHVNARSGDLSARARITVTIDDLTDLVAQGTTTAAPTSTGSAEAAGASGVAARAAGSEGFPLWWIGVALGLLLVVGVTVALVARGRRGSPPEAAGPDGGGGAPPRPAAAAASPVPAPPVAAPGDVARATGASHHRPVRVCPVCGHEGDVDTEFCPNDGATLMDPDAPEVRAQGMICPTCRRGHPAGSDRCTADGDELLPYAFYVARQKHEEAAGKKVCPACGATYGPEKTFCGQDGTPLETVN